tara:strand:- start:1895 stop:2698 length:804 start_codon:yes stop_codon:yes gene_type:complete
MAKEKSTQTDIKQDVQNVNQISYHTETVDLPSGGKTYPEDSPLAKGVVEVKYMTTKEEDILTSQNLIKQGTVIDKLLESLIVTPGVKVNDLLMGDKNGLLVASRVLAYGAEYTVNAQHPNTGETIEHTFNLTDCPYKDLPEDVDYTENEFEYKLPIGKNVIKFKIATGDDEDRINKTTKALQKKLGRESGISARLKEIILSVDGDNNKLGINNFVDNMLARDALAFRREIQRITPDIIMEQDIEWEGDTISVVIPMDIEFFWPKTIS